MSTRQQRRPGIWQRFVTWQHRVNTRVEVGDLSDTGLRDIGLARDYPVRVFF